MAGTKFSSLKSNRLGASAVELAVSSPLVIMLVLGSIEMAREAMVRQSLQDVARSACRIRSSVDGTDARTKAFAERALQQLGIQGFDLSVTVDQYAQSLCKSVTVTISVPYKNVAWIEFLSFRKNYALTAESTFSAEIEP